MFKIDEIKGLNGGISNMDKECYDMNVKVFTKD